MIIFLPMPRKTPRELALFFGAQRIAMIEYWARSGDGQLEICLLHDCCVESESTYAQRFAEALGVQS